MIFSWPDHSGQGLDVAAGPTFRIACMKCFGSPHNLIRLREAGWGGLINGEDAATGIACSPAGAPTGRAAKLNPARHPRW